MTGRGSGRRGGGSSSPGQDEAAPAPHPAHGREGGVEQEESLNALRGVLRSNELRVLGVVGLFTGYLTEFFVRFLKFTNPYVGVAGIVLLTLVIISLDENFSVGSRRGAARIASLIVLALLLTAPQLYNAWTVSVQEVRKEIVEEQRTAYELRDAHEIKPPVAFGRSHSDVLPRDPAKFQPVRSEVAHFSFVNDSVAVASPQQRWLCRSSAEPFVSYRLKVLQSNSDGSELSTSYSPDSNCVFIDVKVAPAGTVCVEVPDPTFADPFRKRRLCNVATNTILKFDIAYVVGTGHPGQETSPATDGDEPR